MHCLTIPSLEIVSNPIRLATPTANTNLTKPQNCQKGWRSGDDRKQLEKWLEIVYVLEKKMVMWKQAWVTARKLPGKALNILLANSMSSSLLKKRASSFQNCCAWPAENFPQRPTGHIDVCLAIGFPWSACMCAGTKHLPRFLFLVRKELGYWAEFSIDEKIWLTSICYNDVSVLCSRAPTCQPDGTWK